MKVLIVRPVWGDRRAPVDGQIIGEREELAPGATVDLDDAFALDLIRKGVAIALDELPMSEIDRLFKDSFATNVGDIDVVNLKRRHVLATAKMGFTAPEYTYTKG